MRKYQLIIALLCTGWTVKAQDSLKTVNLDEVVITGTKSEVPVEKSGKSIYKITSKDIEKSPGKTVADLLNEVPGVQMDGNFGPQGTNISYFVRGATSKRTLILIDGVPFNDPSGINQTYDLRLLDINQVESIEILKGGLSTLYGSGAAAGVINITLKKSSARSFNRNARFGFGSFNTVAPSVGLNGVSGPFSYFVNATYKKSDGFSVAKDEQGAGNFDKDGFKGYNFLIRSGYKFSPGFSLTLTSSIDDFDTDFDGGAFLDGDNTSGYQQFRIGFSPKIDWQNGNLRGELFYSKLDRLFNSPDFFDPASRFIDEYDASTLQTDIILDQKLTGNMKLVGGLNIQKQAFSQPANGSSPAVAETDFNIVDPYVTLIYDQSNFNVQLGSRLNNHSEYGSNLVYNVNPFYLIDLADELDLKLFASYSTSFIAPSLYQLYGPFGNLELNPEESQSFELGASLYAASFTVNAAIFQRKDEALIDFRSLFDTSGNFIGGEYYNTSNVIEVSGIELDANIQLSTALNLIANYTYVQAKDDIILFRIPSHKYSVGLGYQIDPKMSVSIKHNHTGERVQLFFNSTTFENENINTSSFDLIDFNMYYKINKLTFSAAVNNVLDEEYIAILGFNSIERNYTVGINYDF